MNKCICLLSFLSIFCLPVFAQLSVNKLLTENTTHPLAVDTRSPRLSWQLETPDRGVLQTAYEIKVGERPDGGNIVWSSGRVASGQSLHVVYAGKDLQTGRRYYWRVRVWDNKGRVSAWSQPAWWQMGLLAAADWKALWISTPDTTCCPLFRNTFEAGKNIASATVYITAHGLYEAQVNGRRIGDAVLTPGWTSYRKRLQYQAYDVTQLVRPGRNAIGAMLGNGWYKGYIGFNWQHNFYGNDLSLLLQLVIRYKDGRVQLFGTGPDWKTTKSDVLRSEIYGGETIDHRQERPGWSTPEYDP
ncbi:MAG: alpha-L-rhamnosidase N-terminal domain-containing protein, partial [Bacteroidetes bacterium]|nr:alpha-L-rhamnosidase N-terminal domain-containing protein [Bacteroidota bacterium]